MIILLSGYIHSNSSFSLFDDVELDPSKLREKGTVFVNSPFCIVMIAFGVSEAYVVIFRMTKTTIMINVFFISFI